MILTRIEATEDGGYAVTYSVYVINQYESYLAILDENANIITAPFIFHTETSNHQFWCGMLNTPGSNRLLVGWSSQHSGNNDIYYKVYEMNGTIFLGETLLNTF